MNKRTTILISLLLLGFASSLVFVANSINNKIDLHLSAVNARFDSIEDEQREQINSNTEHFADGEFDRKTSITDSGADQLNRIDTLEKKFAKLEELITSLANSNSFDEVATDSVENVPHYMLDEKTQRERELENEIFLEEHFSAQPIDEAWSTSAAVRFEEIRTNPALDTVQIDGLDCRTSICKADISFPDTGLTERAHMDNHLMLTLGSQFGGGLTYKTEVQDGLVKLLVYAVKEGHSLPSLRNGNN